MSTFRGAMRPGLVLLLAVACTSPTPGGRSEMKAVTSAAERVRTHLDAAVAGGDAPGVQYVVVRPSAVLFDGAAGWADLAGRRPLEPGSTMMAYSMTKTVTAAAALQLVERGALALDAPVRRLLPDVPYDDRLTVRHLLDQTSGDPEPHPAQVGPPARGARRLRRAGHAGEAAGRELQGLVFHPAEPSSHTPKGEVRGLLR